MKETSWVQERLNETAAVAAAPREARGEAQEGRKMVMRVLQKKFGAIPRATRARIEDADAPWRERMLDQAIDASSLQDLNLA